MTKKLSELFDLPDFESEKEINESNIEKAEAQVITQEAYSNLEKIENALPQVRGLEASDIEMDELASLATNSYKDLMDLGMQVDSRFASEIFNSASSMLGHAITAKTNKVEKKLKAIDLQLKKYKIDKDNNEDPNDVINGQGYVITDRNELIKKLGGKA